MIRHFLSSDMVPELHAFRMLWLACYNIISQTFWINPCALFHFRNNHKIMNHRTITMTSKMGNPLAGRSLPTTDIINNMPKFNIILFLIASSEGMAFGDIL